MRDPEATLAFRGTDVVRTLRRPLGVDHFLSSSLAQKLVERGDLVSYKVHSPDTVIAQREQFVTLPTEWSDTQLWDAGRFTLRLQHEAVQNGFDLKDASAWNVLFRGQRPVFCDLMSFAPLNEKVWWASGQFSRHFLLTLLLARKRGLHGYTSFVAWRDGVSAENARKQIGWSRWMSRYWPLMAGARDTEAATVVRETKPEKLQQHRANLNQAFELLLVGVKPKLPKTRISSGGWLGYSGKREHYNTEASQRKKHAVQKWLDAEKPDWVADLGCNDGEFSRIALEKGARVIAIDGDHDCIDMLYRNSNADTRLYTAISALDDLHGGRGWCGIEFPGLLERLEQRVDMVLMLALIHHLVIGASVPLSKVGELAAKITRRHLIIEWIGPGDPQLRALCRQRLRDPHEFSVDRQEQSFLQAGFEIIEKVALVPTHRTLALLVRK